MRVRATGFLLVICLVLPLLSACGSNGEVASTPTPALIATATALAQSTPDVALPDTRTNIVPVSIPGIIETGTQKEIQSTADIQGAADLGPPAWVKAGTRITYYNAAASVAQSRYTFVEDPEGPYTDPTTGKHYSRTDEGDAPQDPTTASGDGFGQIDVLAVEGSNVVLSSSLFGIDHEHNLFVPAGGTGAKVAGGVVDGLWIHPTKLAELQKTKFQGVLVLTSDYELNDVTYKAVSFVNSAPGSYQSYVYDTKTGLLLSQTTSTAGASSPINAPGEAPPQGNTQLTITRLAGYRQRNVPGIAGQNPDWVARTSKLAYKGTYNFINPVDPSSANLTYPMDVTTTLGKGGRNWTAYTSKTKVQMPGGQATTGSGVTGTTGLYWMDQTALKNMKKGQVLDKDPITGEQDTVKSIDTQSGSKVVTITAQLPGVTTTTRYDQNSGVLLYYEVHIVTSGTTIKLQLQTRPQ